MVAPRALLCLGNPDYEWLADESGYVSVQGGATGVGDIWNSRSVRSSIVADHGHCLLPEQQYPEVEAFIDKFLLGDHNANTRVEIHPYPEVDHAKWVDW